jgi:hypothetical protein
VSCDPPFSERELSIELGAGATTGAEDSLLGRGAGFGSLDKAADASSLLCSRFEYTRALIKTVTKPIRKATEILAKFCIGASGR